MSRVAASTPGRADGDEGSGDASGHAGRAPGFRDALTVREYRGIWFAQLTSIFGDQLTRLALAILIFDRSSSALLAALSFAVSYLPALVSGPLSGVFVDTLPRRRLMMSCDLARAALVAIMCLPGMPVPALLVLLFFASGLESPFATARAAMLPDVLAGERYPAGQALGQVTEQVGQIIGLATAGALVGILTPRGTLAVDAVTFVVSAALLRGFVSHRPAPAKTAPSSYWATTGDGARVVARSQLLRNLVGVSVVGLGLLVVTEGLSVSYARQRGAGDITAGILAAAVPAGMAIGVMLVTRFVPTRERLDTLRLLSMLWALPFVATALRPPIEGTVALWVLAGALSSYQLLANVMFAQALPVEVRGRAFAFARAVIIAAQGFGLLVAGVVADVVGPSTTIALAGLVGVAAAPYFAAGLRGGGAGRHRRAPESWAPAGIAPLADSSSRPSGRQESMPVSPARVAQLALARRESAPLPVSGVRAEPRTPARWRSLVIYGMAVAILAASLLLAVFDVIPNTTARAPLHMPWWALTAAFVATEIFAVPFQRGRDATLISLSQLPRVLGLFLASPRTVLASAVLAMALCQLLSYISSRRALVKIVVNIASVTLGVLTAEGLFALLRPSTGLSWPVLLVAFAVITFVDVVVTSFVLSIRRLHAGELPVRELVKPLPYVLAAGMAATSLALLAVAAMHDRPSYGLLLLLVGVLMIGGSRAYADLQQRHQDLGELYTFTEALGPLLPKGNELWLVLQQTRELMTATSVELALAAEPNNPSVDGLHRVLTSHVDGEEREFWRAEVPAAESDPSERLSVSLASSGRRLGTLTVTKRLGQIRGFNRSDLQLLETLGGRVGDALEKGLLLERLQDAATHDGLTGLLTLAELTTQLDEELVRGGRQLVLLADVARLKDVNDSLGHEAGDALLRTVADRLTQLAPANALVARSGGGEFAVAIPDIRTDQAGTVVERLAEGLSGLVQVLGVTVDLRTRFGWAHCPGDARDAASVLRRADLALGSAKRGLHRSARYAPELEVDGMRRLRLVNDLRDAIDARGIDVVYQPLVTPHNGIVVGAEALARWTHAEFGPLPPDEFIIVAEQSGLIGKLTELVLDKALAQARAWRDEGRELRIAVNLSARCLSDMTLPGMVLDLLARHRVEAGHLTLEVTETSVAEDPTHAETVLARLRALGLRLSVDDFGTGYSSLAALKRFPVQEVKLDRQFLVDLEAGLEDEGPQPGSDAAVDIALLTAIVALGHSLGLEIVAEGIETPRAYERLRDLGVDVLQGYLIGRPAAGDRLPRTFSLTGDGCGRQGVAGLSEGVQTHTTAV